MSIEAIAVCLHHSRASGTDKLVLLGIANHEGDGGSWPSVATLAKYANCSERTVQRALDNLINSGEVRRHLNQGGSRTTRNDQRTNRYDVLVRCPEGCDGTSQHRNGVTFEVQRGDTGDVNGVTSVAERGDIGVTRTVLEPSIEPSMEHVAPLANLLAECITANGSKAPTITRDWLVELDRMIRIDERTPVEIEAMIRWSQNDSFWRANILSPKKLRAKYDTMRLQQQRSQPSAVDGYLALAEMFEVQEIE